jgi:RHS repeat-associated protein
LSFLLLSQAAAQSVKTPLQRRQPQKPSSRVFRAFLAPILAMSSAFGAQATERVTYYYTDQQGTPLATVDATTGGVVAADFRPFGSQTLGASHDGPGYTGHIGDVDSGLVYMQARYYDPVVGRFLSVDPVGPKAGDGFVFDRYDYANNNPIRYTDPDGRKCTTVDGKDSCTFDEIKDKNGKTISRDQALSSGSKLAKFFHTDMGSRITRAEAAMTAKYSAAKNLAANGGGVTIKGNSALGIPAQNVSGAAIVNHMETTETIASAEDGSRGEIANTLVDRGAPVGHGPITFFKDGDKSPDLGQTFGHEILHTLYSGAGLSNRGWANSDFRIEHQVPFNDASDAIH